MAALPWRAGTGGAHGRAASGAVEGVGVCSPVPSRPSRVLRDFPPSSQPGSGRRGHLPPAEPRSTSALPAAVPASLAIYPQQEPGACHSVSRCPRCTPRRVRPCRAQHPAGSGCGGAAAAPAPRAAPAPCPAPPAALGQEIIDLTCEDANSDPTASSSLAIIDLTEDMCSLLQSTLGAAQNSRNAAPAAHKSHPQLCPSAEKETQAVPEPSPAPASHNTSEKLSSTMIKAETMENCNCLSPVSRHHSWSPEQDYSTTAFNSSLDSESDSDCQSPSPPSLDSNSSVGADGPEEDPPQPCLERNLPPRLSPAPTIPITSGKPQRSLPEASDFPAHQPIQQATPARTDADSKALLDKLHNFSRSGVQHLFLQGTAPNRDTQKQKPELIPRGKLSMVHTTMEENILEGTLCFLNEFVSCQHRPPKDIICHLIKQMLLDTHEGEILNDIYTLLMKIQMEVVNWLVVAVTGIGFSQPREQLQEARAEHGSSSPRLASPQTEQAQTAFSAQKTMLLLQRMLAMAVEVDRSPTCSSRKIADDIFPFILNIPLRSQREALLNTMESQLLRCRLLELLFQHSCDVPTTSSMSLDKILYFLSHSSVLPQFQDETATWQRWDEMLQYLSLLLLSYHSVKLEHLWTSVSDRMKLIAQKAKARLQDSDDISQLDIQLKMNDFISRMQKTLGEPFPPQIQEKLFMLQELFFIVTAA
uniref:SUMO-interacting motif-containing protein 1 isoform X4 n=1 Tax=Agelaius phoeniceus TaxID=39638 RepID=UPI0023EBC712|nr:SUMO-interacting motif-containing protein 1 isoform X4 [Agelaius phoeniceus]